LSLWTTAPCFRGYEFTPAKAGAGVIVLVLVFCNRYYFALHFIRTQRGALKTCLEVLLKRVAPSNSFGATVKKGGTLKPWPELVEGLFGAIVKKGGTLKPWPEFVEGLFGALIKKGGTLKHWPELVEGLFGAIVK
jgi:hypothetical protein